MMIELIVTVLSKSNCKLGRVAVPFLRQKVATHELLVDQSDPVPNTFCTSLKSHKPLWYVLPLKIEGLPDMFKLRSFHSLSSTIASSEHGAEHSSLKVSPVRPQLKTPPSPLTPTPLVSGQVTPSTLNVTVPVVIVVWSVCISTPWTLVGALQAVQS